MPLRSVTVVVSDSMRPYGLQPPGASVHGILRARILEGVAVPSSKGSSRPRDRTQVSCVAGGFSYHLSHQGSSWRINVLRQLCDFNCLFIRWGGRPGDLRKTKICLLPFLETRTWKSNGWRGWAPSRGPRGGSFPPLAASGGSSCPLAVATTPHLCWLPVCIQIPFHVPLEGRL